jgi:peptidoglycan/xylan/chitin deacetylase (PgdA/CDA1 family)
VAAVWISGWRRWTVLAAAVVVAVGAFWLGNLADHPATHDSPAAKEVYPPAIPRQPATEAVAPSVPDHSPTPSAQATASASPIPTPTGEPAEQQPEVPVAQPVTGPRRPPLRIPGAGPSGAHRTIDAEYLALTFDDGPDPRYTPQLLDLLRQHGVTATFCVVGEMVAAHPELVRRIVAEGHTLCNHSWDHDFELGSRSKKDIRADLKRTNAAIQQAVPGIPISYYRQPGGEWTPAVVEVAAELGMSSLHWSVDPFDWQQPAPEVIAQVVETGAAPGAIVLLHDAGGDRSSTVRAMQDVLPRLAEQMRVLALPPGTAPHRLHGRELPPRPAQL